jgi:hypothetical protein
MRWRPPPLDPDKPAPPHVVLQHLLFQVARWRRTANPPPKRDIGFSIADYRRWYPMRLRHQNANRRTA